MLRGKRLVVLAETGSEDQLNMKNIKELVDNNDGCITARDLYEKGSGSTFKVTAKLVVCSNPPIKYKVEAGDDAPGERIEITKFPIKFDPPGEDKHLPNHRPTDTVFVDSLRNEHLSEVFSYFVDGASMWYKEGGLPRSAKVTAATQTNIALNDTITGFIRAELVMESGQTLGPEKLWSAYCGWCGRNQRDSLSQKIFLQEMGRKLQKKRVGPRGAAQTMYIGARFKMKQERDPVEAEEY
jgi:phage/plasmid-associated DNA primase